MKVKRLYEKATGLCCLVAFAIGARAGEVADTVRLHEVVVGEHRSTVAETYLPQSVTVVGHDRLAAAHQPSTLPTLVDLVPGLFVPGRSMMGYGVNSGGAGALLVRGLSSGVGQMLVCIDGEPQFSGIYGHSVADFLQSHAVERVEVLRGPASARYGSNAMGGTLNFVTRQAAADRVATNVSLGAGSYATMQAEATNLVRKGRFSSTVTAQYNRSDNHRPNMDFRQAGALAKLGYRFSDHWRASAMADVNHFYAQLPGTTARPMTDNEQWITRGAANLTLHNDYAGTANMPTQGGLTIYTNFGKHKIDDGTADPLNAPSTQYFRSRDNVAGLSAWQTFDFFRGNRTTFGLDYRHIYGRAYYTDKLTGSELPPTLASGKSHRNEVGAYVDFYQQLTDWLTLDATLRVDHHTVSGTELVPQGALRFRPMADAELKAVVSKGFRNPTMRELYLYRVANADLGPERLMNYELAWQHTLLGGRLDYGLNLFYMKGWDIIQPVVVNGANINTNVGDVENVGLEAQVDYHINGQWGLTTNHSYLHMQQPVPSAPTYKGYLGAHYRTDRWTAQAGVQYVAGLYTQVAPTEQKEDCCQLSASVSHRVWQGLSLWLRGETLLGYRHYEPITGYPMPHASLMAGLSWDF